MGPYGPYKSFCVFMESNGSLWVLTGPYFSLWILMGSNGPYGSLWIYLILMGPFGFL